ncbi:MAG: ThuA domain-containing protein [Planctomycetaceae bacterium]|nr:ThuA domain-containing protein [Planctomycetaceae bacterium]
MSPLIRCCLVLSLVLSAVDASTVHADEKLHAVFVIGTPHYSPQTTLPSLAKQLEQAGFRTSVVSFTKNPEKNPAGLPGLEVLKTADVAVFYLRFLTLPDEQLKYITDFLESGRPVVGFRTSSHAFAYPDNHPNAKWNNGFGAKVLAAPYKIHLQGTTRVVVNAPAAQHPILTGVKLTEPVTAAGSLYLASPAESASVLLGGIGKSKRTGTVTNPFGTHELQAEMTQPVAWTWTNEWGGRTFMTSLGHPKTFQNRTFVRLFLNGIIWASGKDVPRRLKVRPIGGDDRKDAGNPKHHGWPLLGA